MPATQKRHPVRLLLFMVMLAASGWADQVTIGKIRWYTDYATARQVAQQQGKLLWVQFGENPG